MKYQQKYISKNILTLICDSSYFNFHFVFVSLSIIQIREW